MAEHRGASKGGSDRAPGTVYLVGAGPGDPGLLTVRGAECLARADVVVYDYLANPVFLDQARPGAERVYVGKQGGGPSISQDEINRILVERARAGLAVCRLKGGDPFIFGRGGEEALALVEAGVPFEVVPGVTSAIAAPAYAGIPLTHRDLVSTVTFVTGHEDPAKSRSSLDWAGLARGGTLVFFMGVKTLPHIVEQLIAHGRPAATPAAVVRWGTRPEQQTVVGTLGDIVARAQASGITPPALTVVGEVVGLRERLNWFEEKPLFGRRILVTRAREQASAFLSGLREAGAEPVEFPTIAIRPPDSWAALDHALERAADFDWIVFTSANAVRSVRDRLRAAGRDVRALGRARLCAIGPATAEALEASGLRVEVVPPEYRAEAVVAAMSAREALRDRRVLLPLAKDARDVVPKALIEQGARVEAVVAYQSVLPDRGAAAHVRALLEDGRIDAVTFTSASTVRNLVEVLGAAEAPGLLARTLVAAIGPLTAEAAARAGLRVDLVPEAYTIPALTRALVARFAGEAESHAPRPLAGGTRRGAS